MSLFPPAENGWADPAPSRVNVAATRPRPWRRSGLGTRTHATDEFAPFLECGILAHGLLLLLLRLHCGDCGQDKLVAFNRKRRGFCPSCGARRMAYPAAHLVDHVIPHVPVR